MRPTIHPFIMVSNGALKGLTAHVILLCSMCFRASVSRGSGVNLYRRSAASFLFFFERFDPVPNGLRPFLSCSLAIIIQYFSIIFANTNVQANWLWFIGGPPHFFSRHTPPPFYRQKYCVVFTDKSQDCFESE